MVNAPPPPISPNATPQLTEDLKARIRGASVLDLQLPDAFSARPDTKLVDALELAYERDYDHLTVISPERKLLGYLSIPSIRAKLDSGEIPNDENLKKLEVNDVMTRFVKKGEKRKFREITPETGLKKLFEFFEQEGENGEDFAVVTDGTSSGWVVGVVTRADLAGFLSRRPS
ncbi:hypothetical protein BJ508DRAFT_414774 [Ascobolus immersus RN42]|uniref:CBS domain-containing protein n=1 Tax=Ascobolus immersus RN42 TaxID=1160509 RepID=A0A3N4I5E6_ASCIM|nr:hypothetical protein BJ508DRAFT_414774 [Ascobolus immersus RN42]